MTTVDVRLADIKPYEKNQKKHDDTQVNNIAISIDKYGFVQPLVLDKDNNIIIGHGRYLAAEKLKMESVPVVYAENLTDEQIRELRILDNKLNESEWDIDKLKLDLEELDFSEFDLSFDIPDQIEFDEDKLNNLFEDAETKEKEPKKIQCPHCGEWFEA